LKSSMNFGMGAMKKRYDIATSICTIDEEKIFSFTAPLLSAAMATKIRRGELHKSPSINSRTGL